MFTAPSWIVVSRRSFAQTAPPLDYPRLIDITDSTGIHFDYHSSPEQKFIIESLSGGVALIDYDRDGWPDLYFTNAQTVGKKRSKTCQWIAFTPFARVLESSPLRRPLVTKLCWGERFPRDRIERFGRAQRHQRVNGFTKGL